MLKAHIFPTLGLSLLLKDEKYLLVASQGQDPLGLLNPLPTWHGDEPRPHRDSVLRASAKLPRGIASPPQLFLSITPRCNEARPASTFPVPHWEPPASDTPGRRLPRLHSPFTQQEPGCLQLSRRIILVWGISFSTQASLHEALRRCTRISRYTRVLMSPRQKTSLKENQRAEDNLGLMKKLFFFFFVIRSLL